MKIRSGYRSHEVRRGSLRTLLVLVMLAGMPLMLTATVATARTGEAGNYRRPTIGHQAKVTYRAKVAPPREVGTTCYAGVEGASGITEGVAPTLAHEAQYWMTAFFALLSCLILARIPLRLARQGYRIR